MWILLNCHLKSGSALLEQWQRWCIAPARSCLPLHVLHGLIVILFLLTLCSRTLPQLFRSLCPLVLPWTQFRTDLLPGGTRDEHLQQGTLCRGSVMGHHQPCAWNRPWWREWYQARQGAYLRRVLLSSFSWIRQSSTDLEGAGAWTSKDLISWTVCHCVCHCMHTALYDLWHDEHFSLCVLYDLCALYDLWEDQVPLSSIHICCHLPETPITHADKFVPRPHGIVYAHTDIARSMHINKLRPVLSCAFKRALK